MIPLAFIHSPAWAVILAAPIGMMGGIAAGAYFDLAIRSCPPGLQGTLMMLVDGFLILSARGGDLLGSRIYLSNPEYWIPLLRARDHGSLRRDPSRSSAHSEGAYCHARRAEKSSCRSRNACRSCGDSRVQDLLRQFRNSTIEHAPAFVQVRFDGFLKLVPVRVAIVVGFCQLEFHARAELEYVAGSPV